MSLPASEKKKSMKREFIQMQIKLESNLDHITNSRNFELLRIVSNFSIGVVDGAIAVSS